MATNSKKWDQNKDQAFIEQFINPYPLLVKPNNLDKPYWPRTALLGRKLQLEDPEKFQEFYIKELSDSKKKKAEKSTLDYRKGIKERIERLPNHIGSWFTDANETHFPVLLELWNEVQSNDHNYFIETIVDTPKAGKVKMGVMGYILTSCQISRDRQNKPKEINFISIGPFMHDDWSDTAIQITMVRTVADLTLKIRQQKQSPFRDLTGYNHVLVPQNLYAHYPELTHDFSNGLQEIAGIASQDEYTAFEIKDIPTKFQFSQILEELIDESGLTQKELAYRVGMQQGSLSLIANGSRFTTQENLYLLLNYLCGENPSKRRSFLDALLEPLNKEDVGKTRIPALPTAMSVDMFAFGDANILFLNDSGLLNLRTEHKEALENAIRSRKKLVFVLPLGGWNTRHSRFIPELCQECEASKDQVKAFELDELLMTYLAPFVLTDKEGLISGIIKSQSGNVVMQTAQAEELFKEAGEWLSLKEIGKSSGNAKLVYTSGT